VVIRVVIRTDTRVPTSSRGLDADVEFTTEARKARKPYLLDVFRVFRVFVVVGG